MWEQNETGSEREFSEDIGPTIERGSGWLGHDPELALWMVNEGDGMPSGRTDWPAATKEVDLVVGVDTSAEVDGEMEIQEAGVGTRTQNGALFGLGLGAGVVWG